MAKDTAAPAPKRSLLRRIGSAITTTLLLVACLLIAVFVAAELLKPMWSFAGLLVLGVILAVMLILTAIGIIKPRTWKRLGVAALLVLLALGLALLKAPQRASFAFSRGELTTLAQTCDPQQAGRWYRTVRVDRVEKFPDGVCALWTGGILDDWGWVYNPQGATLPPDLPHATRHSGPWGRFNQAGDRD
ncbi:MAG: hypothetical protein QM728_05670 [Gordonia sp. (in: high G+C Gram-positive bacteria)]|uniref:hypothetical protein n=1 Tax=Gordonia sp. (in: high G+C Gram-positive bacteria) TaxID=84139 RepID=UPI0039E32830